MAKNHTFTVSVIEMCLEAYILIYISSDLLSLASWQLLAVASYLIYRQESLPLNMQMGPDLQYVTVVKMQIGQHLFTLTHKAKLKLIDIMWWHCSQKHDGSSSVAAINPNYQAQW